MSQTYVQQPPLVQGVRSSELPQNSKCGQQDTKIVVVLGRWSLAIYIFRLWSDTGAKNKQTLYAQIAVKLKTLSNLLA
jgi:hypothetical protein